MSVSLIAIVSGAQEFVPGEVIVKYKKNRSGAMSAASKAGGASKFTIKKSWDSMGIQHVQAKAGAGQPSTQQLIQQLKADPDVEFVEPNYILKKQSAGVDGPRLSRQGVKEQLSLGAPVSKVNSKVNAASVSAQSAPVYSQTSADIQVEDAWALLTSQTFVPVVAVIDTGLDYNHEVFVGTDAVWENTGETPNNGLDDDGNGYIDDVRGWNFVANNNNPMDDEDHGTHVSGIVLGISQDIFGTPQPAIVKIMPLKFLDSNGSGATSDAIEAIYYAIENGATVINASWGGGGYSQALQDAILEAYNSGVTFVAAAGNASNNNDSSPTYPANYSIPNVISIAATTSIDNLASFSNYGRQSVHIASPGVSILSTLPNESYANASGTSMATPIVAGIVALMQREAGEAINGYQASQILFNVNDEGVGNISGKVVTNSRVNVLKAVSYVQSNGASHYQPSYTDSSRSLASSESASGGCGLVRQVMKSQGAQGAGRSDLFGRALLLLIVLSPFVLAIALKQKRRDEENRRSHQRYNITSEVRISVGDKELVGSVSSISLGGVKIDTDALLEQGGIVEMNIMSPDGKEKVQVLGKVVWSQERKAYGVQFCDMAETQTNSISSWTKKLVKAS